MSRQLDIEYMRQALLLAQKAAESGEVPVGALIVAQNGLVIGSGYNLCETEQDATLHAEMIALRQASAALGRWRLTGCTIYVSLEPCPMCAGALVAARLERLVYAAADPLSGAAGSVFDITDAPKSRHRLKVTGGLLATEATALLQEFFQRRRAE